MNKTINKPLTEVVAALLNHTEEKDDLHYNSFKATGQGRTYKISYYPGPQRDEIIKIATLKEKEGNPAQTEMSETNTMQKNHMAKQGYDKLVGIFSELAA